MKAINLTTRSVMRMTVQSLLVLAALVLITPRDAEAEVVIRAKVGPVQVAYQSPPARMCDYDCGPRIVLRSVGRQGPGHNKCRCLLNKALKPRPSRGIWIKGHYEMRRHQGRVWIPGHWQKIDHGQKRGHWKKHGKVRLHR